LSSYAILHDVSRELRRQIFDALNAAPETVFALADLENVSLKPPNEPRASGQVASCYLYHVDVDQHLRNQPPLPDRGAPDRFRRPPLPLKLRYLLTPVDDDESNNHLLLGRVVQHFHDEPGFNVADGREIGDSFGGASPELRVRPDLLSMEQLAQIWNAFSTPYRLSVSLLVEIVAVDSGRPPYRQPRVREAVTAVGRAER
jgi:hypothetical protein